MNINELLKQKVELKAEPQKGLPCHLQILDITTNSDKWEIKTVCITGKTEHDLNTYKQVVQIPFVAYAFPMSQNQTKSEALDCVLSVFCEDIEEAKQAVYKAILALQTTKLNSLVGSTYLPIVCAKCTYKQSIYETIKEEETGKEYNQQIGTIYHFNDITPILEIEK